jgi:hypothetical protein
MQVGPSLVDGVLEVGEAIIDPSFVGLPSIESLGGILVIGVGAIFIGATRRVEPIAGKAGAIALGVILTVALFANPGAASAIGPMFLFLAAVLKLAAGAALGALMSRSAQVAFLAAGSMAVVAWALPKFLPVLGLDGIETLKLLIVIASGISAYEALSSSDQSGRFSHGMLVGTSILVAAMSLVSPDALLASDPGAGIIAKAGQGTFGLGLIVGFGAGVLGRR